MARSTATDRRFLEQHRGKWRVTVSVPKELQRELGTKLKRPLNTDSLTLANALKWRVIAELRAAISAAHRQGGRDPLTREALTIRRLLESAESEAERIGLTDHMVDRAEEIAGRPAIVELPGGETVETFDPDRERQALAFAATARGEATPIAHYHQEYLAQLTVKRRTRADDERAIRLLETWCEKNRVPRTLQAMTRRIAARFMDGLAATAGRGQGNVTLQKYLSRLSSYWKWLLLREHVEANVWASLKLPVKASPSHEQERPFTTEEMRRLLGGDATPAMHDLMRIAALTGARLDVIVDLRVRDCADGLFLFKPQKKETAPRAVPIHSALREIVERRTLGKEGRDSLFPEWPAPRKAGSQRERSFKASNAFTAYRREVRVQELVPGKRRSLVNFHSFRRWFITEAERAGQPEHIIAAVVGHKRQGMTLGRYSAGPHLEQARSCVEAVKLPTQSEAVTAGTPGGMRT